MAAEIKVQRGVTAVPNTGATDTTFTAVSALTAAFEHCSNNRHVTGGRDDGTVAALEGDDLSGTIELTGTGTLTFTRESGSAALDTRWAWEIIEYIGAGGGNNEFIVRSRNSFTATTNGAPTPQALDTTPTNIDKCIPFITGIGTDATTDSWTNATAVAWINDSGNLAVDFGGDATSGRNCQIVVVEFTGSNWEVYHGDSGEVSVDSGTITLNTDSDGAGGSTGDVTNWGTAAIFHTFKGSDEVTNDAIADTSGYYLPGAGTTTVDWTMDAARDGTGQRHFVHVLRHPDMVVTRYENTSSATGAVNTDITSAGLTDLTQSMINIALTNSGTATGYPTGFRNARLTSTTNAETYGTRGTNTSSMRLQVIDFTGITSAAGLSIPIAMHHYRHNTGSSL